MKDEHWWMRAEMSLCPNLGGRERGVTRAEAVDRLNVSGSTARRPSQLPLAHVKHKDALNGDNNQD